MNRVGTQLAPNTRRHADSEHGARSEPGSCWREGMRFEGATKMNVDATKEAKPDRTRPGMSAHFAGLDGLRGLAALAVLTMHANAAVGWRGVAHGYLAVDLFFGLSGFVIGLAYENKLRSTMSPAQFMIVRVRRLYPLILLSLVIGIVVLALRYKFIHAQIPWVEFMASVVLGLLTLPNPFLGHISNGAAFPFNGPSWSLFFELSINAVYGAFVNVISDAILLCIIVLSGIFITYTSIINNGLDIGSHFNGILLGSSRVLFSFSVGLGVYRLWSSNRLPKIRIPWIVVAGSLTLLFLPALGPWDGFYDLAVVAIAFPAILAVSTFNPPSNKLSGICLLLGRFSYPVYIMQGPVLRILGSIHHAHLADNLLGAMFLAVLGTVCALGIIGMKFDDVVQAYLKRIRAPSSKPVTSTSQ